MTKIKSKTPPKRSGRTDKKREHPKFAAKQITEDNLQLFLKVFPEIHRLFVMEYRRSWNARASYQKIHPNAKHTTAKNEGHKLLQNDNVQLYLDYLADIASERYEISESNIMMKLEKVSDQSMAAVPVKDHKGKETGEYVFNAAGANKSLELMGKQIGMFTNRIQIDDSRVPHIYASVYVVPEIHSIDLADPDFKMDFIRAVQVHMKDRLKNK